MGHGMASGKNVRVVRFIREFRTKSGRRCRKNVQVVRFNLLLTFGRHGGGTGSRTGFGMRPAETSSKTRADAQRAWSWKDGHIGLPPTPAKRHANRHPHDWMSADISPPDHRGTNVPAKANLKRSAFHLGHQRKAERVQRSHFGCIPRQAVSQIFAKRFRKRPCQSLGSNSFLSSFSTLSSGWFVRSLESSPTTRCSTSLCSVLRNCPNTPEGATRTIRSKAPLWA